MVGSREASAKSVLTDDVGTPVRVAGLDTTVLVNSVVAVDLDEAAGRGTASARVHVGLVRGTVRDRERVVVTVDVKSSGRHCWFVKVERGFRGVVVQLERYKRGRGGVKDAADDVSARCRRGSEKKVDNDRVVLTGGSCVQSRGC